MARKKPVISPFGQWAYPGEVTIIPSSDITMKGVNYPVLGIDNLGNQQMMMPGGEYTFPGDYVTEIPQMGKGGLRQWFAEEWTDVKTGKPCGRSGKDKDGRPYPACRPSKRVNETTPKTTSEMSSSEKAKFKREKTSGKRIDYNHKRREFGGESWLDQYQDGGLSMGDYDLITAPKRGDYLLPDINRPSYIDEAGNKRSEYRMGKNIDGRETLIPTVVGGKQLSEDEALDRYYKTGLHMGQFNTPEEADYASRLRTARYNMLEDPIRFQADQFQVGGTLPPIYTSNPRDPRIRNYQDSLNLYKEQNRLNILNDKTNYPQQSARPTINKNNLIYTGDPNKGGYVNPKIFSSNIPTFSKDIHGNLKQQYKKPVQPYIYKKPEVTPKVVETPVVLAPVVEPPTKNIDYVKPVIQQFNYMSNENKAKALQKYGSVGDIPFQGVDINQLKYGGWLDEYQSGGGRPTYQDSLDLYNFTQLQRRLEQPSDIYEPSFMEDMVGNPSRRTPQGKKDQAVLRTEAIKILKNNPNLRSGLYYTPAGIKKSTISDYDKAEGSYDIYHPGIKPQGAWFGVASNNNYSNVKPKQIIKPTLPTKSLSLVKPINQIKNTPKPIYTSDLNDPRLRAYNDSLSLYNEYLKPAEINKTLKEIKNDSRFRYYRPSTRTELNSFPGKIKPILGTEFDFSRIDADLISGRSTKHNYYPTYDSSGRIMPGEIGTHLSFKKPVQPYIYRKPEVIPEVIETPVVPVPVVEPPKPSLFVSNIDRDMYTPGGGMGREYNIGVTLQDGSKKAFRTEKEYQDWKAANNLDISNAKVTEGKGYSYDYPENKKYGGWLDQFQTGGWANFVPASSTPLLRKDVSGNAGYRDNTRVNTINPATKKAAEAAEYAKRVGSISQGKTKSDYEKAREASSFVSQAEQRKGSADPLDYVLDIVNPAFLPFSGIDLVGNTAMGVNNLAKGNFSEAAGNALDAGFNAINVIPATAELRGPLKSAGKYLTTQTPLKNTYKYNPWAFKPNPEAYYRGVGKEGIKDALESRVIKSRDQDLFPSPYFAKPNEFKTALYYNPDALIEAKGIDVLQVKNIEPNQIIFNSKDAGAVPLNPEWVDEVYLGNITPGVKTSQLGHLPIDDPNIRLLQKDWLRGYEEIKKPSIQNSVDNIATPNISQSASISPVAWQAQELPGLHLKSTMTDGPISKIVEPKTGLVNVEQALGIIGKESGGIDKVALIKQGLGENIPKKMDYNDFRKTVQDQLIPLEKQFSTERSDYGIDRLGYTPGKFVTKEVGGKKIHTYESDYLDNQTILFSNKDKFGRGSGAHGNPDETLGHAHYLIDKESPDVLTITQIQSDAFQGTHRSMPKNIDDAVSKLNKTQANSDDVLELMGDEKEKFKSVFDNADRKLQLDKATVENFTQKSLLDKNHQERYLQELVDYAGKQDYLNKVRVPTSETAAKVQGYRPVTTAEEIIEKYNKLKGTPEWDEIMADTPDADKLRLQKVLEGKIKGDIYDLERTTILKKYSEQPKTIKKLFGEEPKLVTDSKGNTWYEFDIPKKFKEGKGEIKAFSTIGGIGVAGAAASQLQEQRYGGWLNKYQEGGDIPVNVERMNSASVTKKDTLMNKYKRFINRKDNSSLENLIEFVDPTGISSHDDAYLAYNQWQQSNSMLPSFSQALDMFGAVPMLGKLGKIKYLDPNALKTAYKSIPWQQIVNAFDTVEDEGSNIKNKFNNLVEAKKQKGGQTSWLNKYNN
jgi:hypothetical protein